MKRHNGKIAPEIQPIEPARKTKAELLKLLSAMEKAMCRQHIMWPEEGDLPCESNQECAKSDVCRKMAEDILDYSHALQEATQG